MFLCTLLFEILHSICCKNISNMPINSFALKTLNLKIILLHISSFFTRRFWSVHEKSRRNRNDPYPHDTMTASCRKRQKKNVSSASPWHVRKSRGTICSNRVLDPRERVRSCKSSPLHATLLAVLMATPPSVVARHGGPPSRHAINVAEFFFPFLKTFLKFISKTNSSSSFFVWTHRVRKNVL